MAWASGSPSARFAWHFAHEDLNCDRYLRRTYGVPTWAFVHRAGDAAALARLTGMDPGRVQSLCDWMSRVLGEPITSFQQTLISGRRLCQLMADTIPVPKPTSSLHLRDNRSLQRYLRSVNALKTCQYRRFPAT